MAGPVDSWFPQYIGEFQADTQGWTNQERGAYVQLQMHLWRNGGRVKYDEGRLSRVIGDPWVPFMETAKPLLLLENGELSIPRMSKHLERATTVQASLSEKNRKAANARWNAPRNAPRMPGAMPGDAPSPTQLQSQIPTTTTREIPVAPEALALADRLRELALGLYPNQPGLTDQDWPKTRKSNAVQIARLQAGSGEPWSELSAGLEWAHQHEGSNGFSWGRQVRSGAAFRKHWASIAIEMRKSGHSQKSIQPPPEHISAAYRIGGSQP